MIVIAVCVCLVVAAMSLLWFAYTRNREGFVPYISLIHVKPEAVPLMLDSDRGPDGSSFSSLSDLSSNNGLWIYNGNRSSNPLRGLCVGDAAMVAYDKDKDPKSDPPQLVAPIVSAEAKRSFFLLSPVDSDTEVPTLGQIIKSRLSVSVFCPTGVESSLFTVAWAVAGGGDVPDTILKITNDWESAAAEAAAVDRTKGIAIVPVWACQGSPVQTAILSRLQYTASISYHPQDDDSEDGFLLESAPHMIKARSPALTASPIRVIPGTRPSDPDSLTQTVLVSPALVLLYESTESSELKIKNDVVVSMAGRVSDAILGIPGTPGQEPEAFALCTFYEALGIPLLPRTEETVRAFEKRRLNSAKLPIMEQFGDKAHQPIELVPESEVSLAISWSEGHAEATLEPHGTTTIDGVRLRAGDRVILENQEVRGDNGTWIVVSSEKIPILQKPVAIYPKGYTTALERTRVRNEPAATVHWQWRFLFQASDERAHMLKRGDSVAWVPLPGAPTGTVDEIKNKKMGRLLEVVVPADKVTASPEAAKFENEWFDPMSRCLDSDAMGNTLDTRQKCRIQQGNVWDKPCIRDDECPFLQEGTETRRGRCLKSGRCEVPVGVRSSAYRSLNSTTDTMVCRCKGGPLGLGVATHECCDLPDAVPVFSMTTV